MVILKILIIIFLGRQLTNLVTLVTHINETRSCMKQLVYAYSLCYSELIPHFQMSMFSPYLTYSEIVCIMFSVDIPPKRASIFKRVTCFMSSSCVLYCKLQCCVCDVYDTLWQVLYVDTHARAIISAFMGTVL